MGGKELDLHGLYTRVTTLGGFAKVSGSFNLYFPLAGLLQKVSFDPGVGARGWGGGLRGPEAFFSLPAGGTEADGGGAVFGLVARVRAAGAGLGGMYVGKEKCRVERRERIYGGGSWCEVFL